MKGPFLTCHRRGPQLGLLAIIACAAPSPALAERERPVPSSDEQSPSTGSASEHFSRGVSFYKSGSLDAALAEFNRAYELRPDYRVLFNIGQVQIEKQDWVAAIRAFRLYLAEGGDQVAPDRATSVRESIKDAQGRVSIVTVNANVRRGDVLVDGVLAGSTPSANPVLVNAGIREIGVRADAYRSKSLRVTVAGGEERTLEFVLEPLVTGSPTADGATPGEAPAAPRRVLPTGAWLAFGGALVLAGGAVTTGLLTRQAQQDFTRELGEVPGVRAEIDRERSQLRLWAGLTDGLTVAAVACVGVGIYLALSPSRSERAQERVGSRASEGPRRAAAANVDAIVTGNGIALRGTF